MYFVYVLGSLKDGQLYVGYSDNLKRRQEDHNIGKVKATKNRGPFKLIYFEDIYINKMRLQERSFIK